MSAGNTQRYRNRDRTTEVVAPPPGDYESKTADPKTKICYGKAVPKSMLIDFV